jgi:hypothetical protein
MNDNKLINWKFDVHKSNFVKIKVTVITKYMTSKGKQNIIWPSKNICLCSGYQTNPICSAVTAPQLYFYLALVKKIS